MDKYTGDDDHTEHRASVERLTKDLVRASITMSSEEARYLVDAYYIHQEGRKRLMNQILAMGAEPHSIITWQAKQAKMMEGQIKRALEIYSEDKIVGRWAKANHGIGPVIAAGLLAHIDITKAPTVGHIWRFGGYDPTVKWEKKQKRPWNAGLKTLFWKIGQSFMKFSGEEECVYGQVYKERWAYEKTRNESGYNKDRSALILTQKNFDKKTEAYKAYSAGRLPPAHVNAQARRYAVKLFLSHLHLVWRWVETGELPPKPYALGQLDHAHFIRPQHLDMVEGIEKAMKKAGL